MKAISELVVHVFDLMEAEGRGLLTVVRGEAKRAQSAASNMAMGLAFLTVAVPLLIGGLALMAAGLMWWLETQVARPMAACLTGLAIITGAFSCIWLFKLLSGRTQP